MYDAQSARLLLGALRGRLKFGGCDNSAPFPSMIVVFEADKEV